MTPPYNSNLTEMILSLPKISFSGALFLKNMGSCHCSLLILHKTYKVCLMCFLIKKVCALHGEFNAKKKKCLHTLIEYQGKREIYQMIYCADAVQYTWCKCRWSIWNQKLTIEFEEMSFLIMTKIIDFYDWLISLDKFNVKKNSQMSVWFNFFFFNAFKA